MLAGAVVVQDGPRQGEVGGAALGARVSLLGELGTQVINDGLGAEGRRVDRSSGDS
jgi:hypothetical protein